MLSRFHLLPERYGQTDIIAISISRVSVLTRDKNGAVFLRHTVYSKSESRGDGTRLQTAIRACTSYTVRALLTLRDV